MLSSIQRGTSPVDWCETNYEYTPLVAEFINTVSSFLFILLPPLSIKLFKQYARLVNRGIYIIWGLFGTVGVCSVYFHATLSLLGQILDEISILWLLATAFGMWVPRRHYPTWLKQDRKQFQVLVFIASAIGTVLAWVYPWINAFALMLLAVPTFHYLVLEMKVCRNARVKRLGIRCAIVWAFALACWLSDRLFCDIWASVSFPYLHGAWHILIAITAYTICVIFAYFDAYNELPEKVPVLRYWPVDNIELGVPYVILKH